MGGGGGGGAVSFLPHQQTEHLIFGQFCSRATQVTSSDGIHVTDVVARNNCCKLYLCMNMELLPRSDHF